MSPERPAKRTAPRRTGDDPAAAGAGAPTRRCRSLGHAARAAHRGSGGATGRAQRTREYLYILDVESAKARPNDIIDASSYSLADSLRSMPNGTLRALLRIMREHPQADFARRSGIYGVSVTVSDHATRAVPLAGGQLTANTSKCTVKPENGGSPTSAKDVWLDILSRRPQRTTLRPPTRRTTKESSRCCVASSS